MSQRGAIPGHANRLLAMTGSIVRAAVRADSPDMLYREACHIAVGCGLFHYAWVGLVDPAGGRLRRLAHAGAAGGAEDLPELDGIAASLREHGQDCICMDLSEQSFSRHGVAAVAAVPLRENGRTAGVFILCTVRRGLFDEAAVSLLREAGQDISFSLEHMLEEQRRLAAESKLYYMAFYDAQTGLPNRALLEQKLPPLAGNGAPVALLAIRLQRLDRAQHLFGRLAMDDVLRLLAQRLEALRGEGILAQVGQDEFALALPGLDDAGRIEAIAGRVLAALEEPVRLGEREAFLGASVGAAIYPRHDAEIGRLLRRARAASDHNGTEGGFRMYSEELDRGVEQRARTEAELHRALERGEFQLYYQPQLSLRTGAVVGVEALLQWQHPQRGLVGPGQFVPLLEECGLMPAVGGWALRQACRQARAWQEMGLPPLRMGVNLSALQFRLAQLASIVRGALDEAGLAPEYLELELTESLILENVEQTIQAMHELKQLGVRLSLDDFGTGYSSLSYLRRYPVDRIKIDQSFIRDMLLHAGSAALVRSILAMAYNLGLETIAEGVETIEQFEYLRRQPCDEMQGFLFSRAIPAAEIACMLSEGRRLLSARAASDGQRGVLLVDTDVEVLDRLRSVLTGDAWNVMIAASAEEAFALLAAHQPGVVVSGLREPGAAFLHRVRRMYPDTVRIFLSGKADASAVIDAVNRGEVYRVLEKPVEPERLQACMRDAIRRPGLQPGSNLPGVDPDHGADPDANAPITN
ncbi:EAL domain-containing protein [Noviherbaspirillum sp.]|uniref:EAL domain-containing protein n=1 Tax=Noviherbaspirillum sp. TaxID=1926288 RepID=UPI002D692276|nr:EAL domain-containing protein [Noviherbaspirillum sp.]HZW23106.1 EAL domain-containing protein [Noviherbaspirillum sp.]